MGDPNLVVCDYMSVGLCEVVMHVYIYTSRPIYSIPHIEAHAQTLYMHCYICAHIRLTNVLYIKAYV